MENTIGSLVIDIAGKKLTQEDVELLSHPLVGGVILFARNYENRAQLADLCKEMRQARSLPLLIMVDQEGGRVQRFISDFTKLPPLASYGDLYDIEPANAFHMAGEGGWLMATELLNVGVDLSFAPVLDLKSSISPVIGDRAFHSNQTIVTQLALAFIQGMTKAGMAATGKHFPGHGRVSLDSHTATPRDERSYAEIVASDMQPFIALIEKGIPSLMMAHIIFSAVDNVQVSFSGHWLQDILRKKLNFKGVIFSDDLNMEGANISANYADRVSAARDAGCDLILLCNNRVGVIQALDQIVHTKHQISAEKWQPLKGCLDKPLTHAIHQQTRDVFLKQFGNI